MTNTGSAVEPHVPAGAAPAALDFGEMLRRAKVLANTELVPKPLQGKPEAIVLVGALGAELGVPFVASLSDIHVIEGRPSPSAQLRLALIRRAGHDARFVETSSTKAIIEGRRADSDRWTRVEWTIDDARRAGLLDRWVEQWKSSSGGKRYAEKVTVGDDSGIFTDEERARRALGPLPEWATKAVASGEVKAKDNWVKYPAEMLRARAASAATSTAPTSTPPMSRPRRRTRRLRMRRPGPRVTRRRRTTRSPGRATAGVRCSRTATSRSFLS
jgi:hypothetical protein